MGIINCKDCGVVCLENVNQRCPDCQRELQQAEQRVIEYLENYQGASLDEVHKATRVPRPIILQMIRSNRILSGNVFYPCESCGELISKGRICSKCADDAITYYTPKEKVFVEPERRSGTMYTRHSNDRRR